MVGKVNIMSDNKMNDIMRSSVEGIKSMLDANTVIGDPIVITNGTTIIPVSKISVGFASGGLDYSPSKKEPQKASANNFGGGSGTGLTVSPVAFLIVSRSGSVELLDIGAGSDSQNTVSQIVGVIDRSPDIISGIKDAFSSLKKDDTAE